MTYLFLYFAFGCLGITTEIWFTALSDFLHHRHWEAKNFSLRGHSYGWMFFIYGLAGILFHAFYGYIEQLSFLLRVLLYVVGIFSVEFIAGFLLDKLTGRCPWHYTSRWAIGGYIRLDYAPFWAVFGVLIEHAYLILRPWHFGVG